MHMYTHVYMRPEEGAKLVRDVLSAAEAPLARSTLCYMIVYHIT